MRVGLFLAAEECMPEQLIEQAKLAADAGMRALWVSDHFHPWTYGQGHSSFVRSVIGAVSQACDLPVMTAAGRFRLER